MRKDKPASRPRSRRRWLLVVGTLTLLLLVWIGSAAWLASRAWDHLKAAQAALTPPLGSQNAAVACAEAQAAGSAVHHLRMIVNPASPLLRQLGWFPRYGPALAAAPALLDTGSAGAALVAHACQTFAPAFVALDQPAQQRLASGLSALQSSPPDWSTLERDLAALAHAWNTIPASAWESGPLAPYRDRASQIDGLLPAAQSSLGLGATVWPALGHLLGVDAPTTLLVVGQNPFELRPTGGFVGSLGTVTISNGQILNLDYRGSGELNVSAPPGSEFPQPYADYLRGSQWLLRDANWWPDWSHSARAIETFWELNGGAPVDGVVAVDLYALQELLGTFDSLTVPGYGQISDTASLEAIYTFYEPQGDQTASNKAFLGALFAATLQRVQASSRTEWPLLGAAIHRSFDARHISVFLHDAGAREIFAAQHWDGATRHTTGDYLQVVDADLSYSDVQAFIDQQIGLQVELDAAGAPLTNTLTITYTNRYDDWAADQTRHQVYGYCYNVRKPAQERIPGCYGDYVRVYLPPSAAPLELIGADSALEPGREDGLAVAGFYMLLHPGQTRTITLRYRPQPAAPPPYRLLVQKQAGTLARPFALRVVSASGASVSAQADLWHDLELRLGGGAALELSAPPALHPANTPQRLATQARWAEGWQLWQAGDATAAVGHWQATGTVAAALDQVVALRWQNDLAGAQRLLAALEPATAGDGRAAFLKGQLAELRGDSAAAQAAYRQALAISPDSQVARFALGMSQHAQDDEPAALATLRGMADPVQALHRREFDQRYARDYAAADRTNRLILAIDPANRAAWENRYWMLRIGAEQIQWTDIIALATDALATLPERDRWLGRRAEAYSWASDPAAALADWTQVTVISPTNHAAWYQRGVGLLAIDDLPGAQHALEKATQFDGQSHLEYYVALADVYERLTLRDKAIATYRIAANLAPDNEVVAKALDRLEGSE